MHTDKIRGVNLGNWLVLEKWMHPDLFAGTSAEDEDALCRELPNEELRRRLRVHRDSYITRDDFIYLKEHGINVIRIPVPHFIFGDDDRFCIPYVSCAEYLDLAFCWAGELGLKILIDLHTAPESQNGFDNGGISGVCKWAQEPERVEWVLQVLEKLAVRYGDKESLWGIELMNEPVSEAMWEIIQRRYKPHDSERAKGSDFIPLSFLREFYKEGYRRIRRHMDDSKAIVIHDGFRFDAWHGFMSEPEYKNVILDVHWYLGVDIGEELEETDYMEYILEDHVRNLKSMKKTMPVIIGEWCLCHDSMSDRQRTPVQEDMFYRLVAAAQLSAWEECEGYFFWSYKLIADKPEWDFRRSIERGWLPERL